MATQKQIDANQRNAAHSTGPKTDAGKDNSRYNAVKHGFCSPELDLLPKENAQAFQTNLDNWYAEYLPTNLTEARLVRQIAVLSWKLDRAERYEMALLNRRVHVAVEEAKRTQRDHVRFAVSQLLPREADAARGGYHPKPAEALLETVEGSAEGCRELFYRWQTLRNRLHDGLPWSTEDEMHAIRLLGGGPSRISDPTVLELVVANRILTLSPDVLVEPFTTLEGPLGLTLDQHATRDAYRHRPRDLTEARAALMATVDRERARLRSVLEAREREGDAGAQEIALAAELASFDMSKEAENLRRHHVTMQRQFVKSVETISKLRLQEMKMRKEWAKLGEIRANEPNLEAGDCPNFIPENRANEPNLEAEVRPEQAHGSGTTRATQEASPPEIRANEPNLTPEVQVTFTPERESAVEPTPPVSKPESRRARKNRERALRRRLGKA